MALKSRGDIMNKYKINQGSVILITVVVLGTILILLSFICNQNTKEENVMIRVEPQNVVSLAGGGTQTQLYIDACRKKKTSLAFLTSHQYVTVVADGEVLYELKQTGGMWGHTTGNVWNFVVLPNDVQKVYVQLLPCYPETAGNVPDFYVGIGGELYTEIMRSSLPAFMISMLIVIVGIYMISYWYLVRKETDVDPSLLYLGYFSILLGFWAANETNTATLLLLNRLASQFCAFLFLMMMPVPFLLFVRSFLRMPESRIWRSLCRASILMDMILLILQFAGICDLRRAVTVIHAMIAAVLFYLIGGIIAKIIKHQMDGRLRLTFVALAIVTVATIGDMISYYSGQQTSGTFGRTSFLLFILVLGIESARSTIAALKRGRKAKALEEFALNDSMTGMYNRNAYNHFVKHEKMQQCEMIVTFDLNNLKRCNDVHGHAAGDVYITESASLIERVFERYGNCYRIGGDEFCCIIKHAASCPIERLIMRMRQDVELLNHKRMIPVNMDIACGYAFVEPADAGIEDARKRADMMMYENKKSLKRQAGELLSGR